MSIHEKPVVAAALDALAAQDPHIARALAKVGVPEPRVHPKGFATLLKIIIGQQVSTHAAAAIWGRLSAALDEQVLPDRFLALGEAGWRQAGLSRPKMRYAKALSEQILAGVFIPEALEDLDDAAAVKAITALLGFGRWSAEIYLMFALARPDIMPAEDLAIQVGFQQIKDLEARPKPAELRAQTAGWAPHRSAATLLLWKYYGAATLDGGK